MLGLRSRLVLLVLLALLPVFGLFAYSAAKNRQAIVAQAQASLQSEALLAALHQQRLVERVAQLLDDISSGPSIRDTRNRVCLQYLKSLQSQDRDYLNLGVVGLDGKVACHAMNSDAEIDASDRPFFSQVMAGEKFAVGGYGIGRGSGRPGIAFGKPVYGEDERLNGVAFAAVDIAAVSGVLAMGQLLGGAQLRVIDRRGIVLAVRPASLALQGRLEQDAVVLAAARAGQAGVREAAGPGGVARVYAYAPVGGAAGGELFVAISVPREVITAGPDALLRTDIAALLLMTAFGVALAWWMGNRLIVNRAQAILRQAREVTHGNLSARVEPGLLGQDEIGQISQAFNRMAEALQARRSELDAALRRADEERILLHLVLNSMSEGVIAIDTSERFLMVNASARKLYAVAPGTGSALQEWRSSHELLTLDGETPCQPADRPLMQALRGASMDNWVRLLRRPGHGDRVLRVSARPLRDASGQLFGAVAVMSDITGLKAAEAALVSSEARFRELAENIDDVFYNVDARTKQVLYVSPAYQKIWGRTCQSLYAEPGSYARAAVPEDRPVLALAHKRNRAGERSEVQYRILTPDGQTRWIRDHSYPVFNAAGELERIVGTALDISASKLADLALSRTNRALQMLSRSSIAINRINDEASLLAEVCRVAVEVGGYRMAWVGYARDDEDGSIQVMAHAGDETGYLAAIALSWRADTATGQGPAGGAIRSGQPEQRSDISTAADFFWREAALQRGYRSCIALPLSGEQRGFGVLCLYAAEAQEFSGEEVRLLQELADNLAFGIGSLRARLERDRSQEAARQAALKLREQASLMDQAQDAIMVRNLDGTLRFWNKGAERLFGWSAEEVLGKTMQPQMYRDPEAMRWARDQIMASDGLWTGQLEKLAKDGSLVAVEARWSVVHDEQGRVNGMLGINTDIRERRRAHEEIMLLNASLEERVNRRTAQLKAANQQLEAFSYSVSHDLRSPLSAIAGFSALLDKTLATSASDPQAERGRHYLTRIRSGVAQMGELIDAMLLLAQVSRASMRWEAVDLSALASDLLAGYEERDPARATVLRIEPGLQAEGDPRLLRQLLDNLLGNAWKFTQRKPLAEISVGRETGSAGETVYFVRDNGAGFDMAYAEKLFGAFERLHAASEFAGHGVGLATVQRIVARHGGSIRGESTQGQGASFYFTLGKAMH